MRELIEGPLTQREVDMKLSDLLLDTVQGWKWEALSFELPANIKGRIKAIPGNWLEEGKMLLCGSFLRMESSLQSLPMHG